MAHTGRVEQALAQFRKTGSEREARLNLALALTMNQRWDEAREQYQAALAANPTSDAAKNGLRQLETLLAWTTPPASSRPVPAPREQPVEVAKAGPDYLPPAAPEFSTPALLLPKVIPASMPASTSEAPAQPAVLEKPYAGLSQALTFFHLAGQETGGKGSNWSSAEER
jgi:hypothetical protein